MLKITIVALGDKMPDWVNQGAAEYTKRFKSIITIKLIELPLTNRSKSSTLNRILVKESAHIINAIPGGSYPIALDVGGREFSSPELAQHLSQLQHKASHWCLIIGGPEGLSQETLALCHERWSLSKLTLPHPLVRIVLFETLYRAWAIMNNHPYHK